MTLPPPSAAHRSPTTLGRQVLRKAALVLATVAGTWLLALAAFVVFQGKVFFPASGPGPQPFVRGGKVLRLPSPGGEVVALYFPGRGYASTLIYFHGNGEQLIDTEDWAFELSRRGLGVLSVEYPGYGLASASGPPSEAACYAAAETAIAWLREEEGVPRERTVLVGHSLGAAIAAEMALRGHADRLVLLSPITSTAEVARMMFPYLPVSWLVRDRFATLEKAPRITVPTLILHGRLDEMAPVEMGRRIAEAMPDSVLVLLNAGRHDLLEPRLASLSQCVAQFVREKACWIEL